MGREAQNEGNFNKIPIIKQDTTLSHKLLVKLVPTTLAIGMPKKL